jgi:hypothetical protein
VPEQEQDAARSVGQVMELGFAVDSVKRVLGIKPCSPKRGQVTLRGGVIAPDGVINQLPVVAAVLLPTVHQDIDDFLHGS